MENGIVFVYYGIYQTFWKHFIKLIRKTDMHYKMSLLFFLAVGFAGGLFAQSLDEKKIDQIQAQVSELQCELKTLNQYLGMSESFLKYEQEFSSFLENASYQVVDRESLVDEIQSSQVVLLADNHLSYHSQSHALGLLKTLSSPNLSLVIEWIDVSYQAEVNEYLAGKVTLVDLKTQIKFHEYWDFSWESYKRVLKLAKDLSIEVRLVENLKKTQDLRTRDQAILRKVKSIHESAENQQVLVVYGTYHILGKDHLFDLFKELGYKTTAITSQATSPYMKALYQFKDARFRL